MTPNPRRIGLFQTAQKQQPFAEFDRANNWWRIWLAYNPDVTSGTYLLLYPTGAVDRFTVRDGDVLNITKVM